MRLIHYSAVPISEVYSVSQERRPAMKPQGLWVSDENEGEASWSAWCHAENFGVSRLSETAEIVLRDGACLVRISNAEQIDSFTAQYQKQLFGINLAGNLFLDWQAVAERYQGIIISPYIWSRRLDDDARWYYGWDCASGCIWDAAAVLAVKRAAP